MGFNRGLTQYKIEAASSQMPSTMQIGLGYRAKIGASSHMVFSGSFENDNYGIDKYKGGVEISFVKSIAIRGGYLYSTDMSGIKSIFQNFTLGMGVDLFEYAGIPIGIDYAYVPVQYFDANHLIDIYLIF